MNAITSTKNADLAQAGSAPPVVAYLTRLRSEASRTAMRSKLDKAAALLSSGQHDAFSMPWASLEPAHVSALASVLASDKARPNGKPYAARTINATISAVRGVLREAWRAGIIDGERLARLGDVRPEPVPSEPAGRGLGHGEILALFESAGADRMPLRGSRDAALLALLFGAGLRESEACALDVESLDLEREAVQVMGKGRKLRTVELATGAADHLLAWMACASIESGPLLRSVTRGDVLGGRLSPRAVQRATRRLADAAGVAAWTPHDARRTYVGDLLDRGADLSTVQRLAGHASPETTARYDRRPAEVRRKAARLLSVPASPRPSG